MKKSSKTLFFLGGGTKSLKSSQKRAFTLAEVLITLAIIGVVAALTIPVVVQKYQQKQFYTQFMKAYNSIVNTVNLSIAENGSPSTWSYNSNDMSVAIGKYVLPYFKVISSCNSGDSGCEAYEVKYLSGENTGVNMGTFMGVVTRTNIDIYTLSDGSDIGMWYAISNGSIEGLRFGIDTNGAKGPNTFGRDIFYLGYERSTPYINGKYVERWNWTTGYYKGGVEDHSGSLVEYPSNCDPNVSGNGPTGLPNGLGCGGRLLEEGKMSY